MGADLWSLMRAEVLRQLVGATSSWVLTTLMFVFIYLSLRKVSSLVEEGKLLTTLKSLQDIAFVKGNDKENKEENRYLRVSRVLQLLAGAILLLLIGYHLGYSVNSAYISGDISLIVTVDRITNFYKLTLVSMEWTIIFVYSLTLMMMHRLYIPQVGKDNKKYKLLRLLQKSLSFLGILLAFVIPFVSIILCYISLVRI